MTCLLAIGLTWLGVPQDPSEKIVIDLGGGVKMEFVRIQAGKFTMGSRGIVSGGGETDIEHSHEVTITKDYWMQTTETTQAQWEAVMGKNPSHFKGAERPVERVRWGDCRLFLGKLNEKAKEQLKGRNGRLPTEAEWEYACRAGEEGDWCFGDDESRLDEYAWYAKNSDGETHPVGQKKPNRWGLFDMHGNVYEWCQDQYGPYPHEAVTDPTGPLEGSSRSARGGCWGYLGLCAGSSNRSRFAATDRNRFVGVRPVLQ